MMHRKMVGGPAESEEELTDWELELARIDRVPLVVAPLKIPAVLTQMTEWEKNWDYFNTDIRAAVKLHEKIVSLLVESNSKMVAAVSANKLFGKRLAEVDDDEYAFYAPVIERIRAQIIRTKIYLDGYTSVRSVDMIADYLLNIRVAQEKAVTFVEGIQFGSEKYDIVPISEEDPVSLQKSLELLDALKAFENIARETIETRDLLLKRIERLDELGSLIVEDIGRTAVLLEEYSEDRISAKKGMDLLFLIIGAAAIGTLIFVSRSITGPIDRIMYLLQEFSRGHISERLDLKRNDELGKMGAAMDKFSDVLENQFVVSLQKISRGDLSFQIPLNDPDDVINIALNDACKKLNDLMAVINETADNIATGSTEISEASQSLAEGASEQAASLEQMTSSIEEVGGRAGENAEKAETASRISALAKEAANNGNAQMVNMLVAMGDINDASTNIQKIIKVIDEIAFQTNLLALNAAVEAARAGKHGKGFAVVAEEVRSLASRSAEAARQTAELIEGSVRKTEKGMEISNKTAEALSEIEQGITQVSDLVEEIAGTAKGQATGIKQIRAGVGRIETVTQKNTQNASESASVSKDQAFQATLLKNMLSRFKLRERRIHGTGKQGRFGKLPSVPVKISGHGKSVH
ncbi:MAG: methyl-accepting chemotaxis protein [Nitrospinota bacterium]